MWADPDGVPIVGPRRFSASGPAPGSKALIEEVHQRLAAASPLESSLDDHGIPARRPGHPEREARSIDDTVVQGQDQHRGQGSGSGLGAVPATDGAPGEPYVVLDDVGFSAMEPFGGPIETRTSTGSRSAVSRTRTSTRSCPTRSWEARRARATSLKGCDWTLRSQRLCRSPSWRRSDESPCLAAPPGMRRARSWLWRPQPSAGGIVAATCQARSHDAVRSCTFPRISG